MANETISSPLCTRANPQRFVQKAATAKGGSGVSDLAASSRPVRAEVMETEQQRADLRPRRRRGFTPKVSKHREVRL